MQIALHNLATQHSNLITTIRIAHETGYAGVEINGRKLKGYLAEGLPLRNLLALLQQVPAVGLSYVQDIERQEPADYRALLVECEESCALAQKIGAPMVQLLTGPLDPRGAYQGLAGKPWSEMRKLTAKNLRTLADIGRSHGVRFYLEGLTFTPLGGLAKQIELLEETARDEVGLVLDFYHLWGSGTTPDEIARMDQKNIFCVDFCDSLDPFQQAGDIEQRGRNVWPGGGRIPLKEWVDAVQATGFDGIWRSELLSPKYWELDPWTTARDLRTYLEYLLI
jgi:sugar phosphate isomerase/epimerase